MDYLVYILIFIVVILIFFLFAIDFHYKNKLNGSNSDLQNIVKSILKQMLNIMSLDIKATDKVNILNKLLIEKFKNKYSTICLFDGESHNVTATNVEKEYVDSIKDIINDTAFRKSISKRNIKYIVSAKNKTLLYKSAIERKIKSAIFIPLYFENNYLGFVFLEDDNTKNLESLVDKELLELQINISNFVENTEFQNILENANKIDTQTNFYNNVYLYSNARRFLAESNTSAMIVIKLVNLPNINEKYNRNVGNVLLVKMANATKEILGEDNIYIRYSGLRFIVFAKNSTAEIVQPKVENLLSKYKQVYEYIDDKKVSLDTQVLIHTLRKQNNIEKEINKTMSYIDFMKNINTIKII